MAGWVALATGGLFLAAIAWVAMRVWADREQSAAPNIVQGKGTCTPKIKR